MWLAEGIASLCFSEYRAGFTLSSLFRIPCTYLLFDMEEITYLLHFSTGEFSKCVYLLI